MTIETEMLATAAEPNLGDAPVKRKLWDDFAGLPKRLRTVPWYKVLARDTSDTPIQYVSSAVSGLSSAVSQIPTDGEVGTPLTKTAGGVAFQRLRLLE